MKTDCGENTNATKLERVGVADTFRFQIEDIRAYSGVTQGEKILKLAIVFRGEDSKKGRQGGKGGGYFYRSLYIRCQRTDF